MAGRTFAMLRKEKSPREFNRFCKNIAEEYAETDTIYASTYFTQQYNISVSCYNSAKDYAVTHFLVSNKTIERMKWKAKANQEAHYYRAGASTDKHYNALMKERREYVFSLAQEYARFVEVPLKELMDKHGRDSDGYFYIIREAMLGNYGLTTETIKQIQIRMLMEATNESECCRVSEYFVEVWKSRSSAQSHPI